MAVALPILTLTQKEFYKIIETELSCLEFLKQKGLISQQPEKCTKTLSL